MTEVARIGDRVYGVLRARRPTAIPFVDYEFTPLTPCGACHGTGDLHGPVGPIEGRDPNRPCPACSGTGAQRCSEFDEWHDLPAAKPGHAEWKCPSPGCWHGYERKVSSQTTVDAFGLPEPPITMTDRQARDMGASLLREGTIDDSEEKALIAAWILAHD